MSKPRVIVAALCVVVVLAGVGLWAFQDTVLGAGPFEDAEHATSGDVRLIPG